MASLNRFGAWHGGPDPLEAPIDIRATLAAIGDDELAGPSPCNARNRFLRSGPNGRNGLDALRQRAMRRARELRRDNRLDGTLEQAREQLRAGPPGRTRPRVPPPRP